MNVLLEIKVLKALRVLQLHNPRHQLPLRRSDPLHSLISVITWKFRPRILLLVGGIVS